MFIHISYELTRWHHHQERPVKLSIYFFSVWTQTCAKPVPLDTTYLISTSVSGQEGIVFSQLSTLYLLGHDESWQVRKCGPGNAEWWETKGKFCSVWIQCVEASPFYRKGRWWAKPGNPQPHPHPCPTCSWLEPWNSHLLYLLTPQPTWDHQRQQSPFVCP